MPRGEGAAPRAPFLHNDIEPCSYKKYMRTSLILVQVTNKFEVLVMKDKKMNSWKRTSFHFKEELI
jgi:hypothetical protein